MTTAAKQKEIANAVESIPLTNATAVARAATKAECELGIPPVDKTSVGRHSFFVIKRSGTLIICANTFS